MTIFVELALIIFVATICAFLAKLLRQPLLVGYIAAGILVGPYALNLLHSTEEIELFSKIGVATLLFIVGLSLNPDVGREVGKPSLYVGIGQVLFTSIIGYFLVLMLGFDSTAALYIAVALTFSSTIIILKLLADKGDIGKLYGKISVGMLLVQDLVATLILVAVTVWSSAEGAATNQASFKIVLLLLWGLVVGAALYLISKYLLPHLAKWFAGNQELLFVFSLAWGLGLAALFQVMGFSVEIGALVAGITLAASPFAYEIGARLKPLRDFFILLFFILLGAQMVLTNLGVLLVPAVVLSLFVLIGNPLIVVIILGLLGYRPRTSFMTGLTVAQISEFSLILVSLGLAVGHLNAEAVSLVTLVGIITITASTYFILYSDFIYKKIKWLVKILIWRKPHREKAAMVGGAEMVIFGYDRVGYDFVASAQKLKADFVVVDFNPHSIAKLERAEIPFRYGDAEDVEFLQDIGLIEAKMIISTIPDFKTNLLLVNFYRQYNSEGIIIVISHDIKQTRELYLAGASYVVMPHYLGAHHASELIKKHGFDLGSFEKERNKHLAKLAKRE